MAMANQQDIFNQRLARIHEGTGPNLMGQTLVGAADTNQRAPKSRKFRVKKRLNLSRAARDTTKAPLIERLLGMPMALMTGAGVVLTANVGLFHMYSAGHAPMIDLPQQLVTQLQSANGPLWVALGVAVLAVLLFKVFSLTRLTAFAVGFCAMMYGENQLQDQYPQVWATLYAPQIAAPLVVAEGLDGIIPTSNLEGTVPAVAQAQTF